MIENVTMDDNQAGRGGQGGPNPPTPAPGGSGGTGGSGGGVLAVGTTLSFVTATGGAPGAGGPPGEDDTGGGGPAGNVGGVSGPSLLTDSVVAENTGVQCSGTIAGPGDISFPDASCGGLVADPRLGSLAGNGGPTKTLMPGPGSPAIDLIPFGPGCTGSDQRGTPRPQGPGCDSGAVEVADPALTSSPSVANFGTLAPGQSATQTLSLSATFDALTPTASLTGPEAGDFKIASDQCTGLALVQAESCTVQIHFVAGNQLGVRGADLHFSHTASGPPVDIPLTATVAVPGLGSQAAAPTLSALSLTNATFAVGKAVTATAKPTHRHRRPPLGTTIRFRLSTGATVLFLITRTAPGRRGPHGCVAPPGRLKHAKRCTRTITLGLFTRGEPPGADRVAFSGRLSHGPLKRGSYLLTATPTDAAHVTGRSQSIAFKIVKL
jgi:hypothetical protein